MSVEDKIAALAKQIFEDAAANLKLPGLSYGVRFRGKLAASGHIGFADPFTEIPASEKSVYPIASMAKSFVGAAILILRDRQMLSLSDPVQKYVPELRGDSRWQDITVYDLVTMRAGLPEDDPWGDRQVECSDSEFSEIFSRGAKGGFIFCAPRQEENFYSNLSYMLLGRTISKASNQHALQFISDNILRPLGMTSSVWSTSNPDLELAVGSSADKVAIAAPSSIGDGAVFGGLLSSVPDILIWVDFLMRHSSNYDSILKEPSRRELRTGGRFIEELDNTYNLLGYAFGLVAHYMPEAKLIRFGHRGGLPGFGSRMSFIPAHQISVVALSNLTYAPVSDPCKEFLDEVVKILPFSKYIESPLVEKRFGELLGVIESWDANKLANIFASNFFKDNSEEEIRLRFEKFRINLPTLKAEKGLVGHFYAGEEKVLTFTLAPVEDGKIQSIEFS